MKFDRFWGINNAQEVTLMKLSRNVIINTHTFEAKSKLVLIETDFCAIRSIANDPIKDIVYTFDNPTSHQRGFKWDSTES